MIARAWIGCFLAVLVGACSAVVDTDPSRLGGIDASARADSSAPDAGDADTGLDGDFDAPPMDAPFTDAPADTGRPPGDTGADGPARDTGGGCLPGCTDGITCTDDACVGGACVHTPNDGLCGPGGLCHPTMGCVPRMCTTDPDCDDGVFCNGPETCNPGSAGADARGCVAGAAPSCNDGFSCTSDTCSSAMDSCDHAPRNVRCNDRIGCTVDRCDTSMGARPTGCVNTPNDTLCVGPYCTIGRTCSVAARGCTAGVARDCRDGLGCTADSCDNATRMCVHTPRDADMDGFPALRVGGVPCVGGTDCNDGDRLVHPGATELCNGFDDNCNGAIDEGCTSPADTCASAQEIVPVLGRTVTVSGSFLSFAPNYQSPCGGTGGRDAVYYVDVPSLMDLTIDTIGSATDTVVAVGTTCGDAGWRLGCDDDIVRGTVVPSRIWVHRFGPLFGGVAQRLYILVDGYNASVTGAFVLNVTARSAARDSCTAPINISGGGSMVGFQPIVAFAGAHVGSCQTGTSRTQPEALATLRAPDGSLTVTGWSDVVDLDLYLRRGTCRGTEVACTTGAGVPGGGYAFETALTSTTTAGTQYYLFIDNLRTRAPYFIDYEP